MTKKLPSERRLVLFTIVLALAIKDIVDAIKNKTTLTMLVGLGLMILTVQALPLLLKFDDRPRVAIYDAARSGVADELRRDRAVQVSEMRSKEEARIRAQEASGPLLAVALPEDLESTIQENAEGPKRAQGDAGSMEQHSLPDQIAADRYLNSKRAANKGAGVRFTKLTPPGA